jgi:hypothetical protein
MASAEEPARPYESLPRKLPLTGIERGSGWWRLHASNNAPVFFGPARGTPPTHQFDAPHGEYRILYLGETLSAAFVETLLRNPQIPFIEQAELRMRSASVLINDHALRLVDLRGGGLSRIGADNRLTTGSYEIAGQWALALWRHAECPDGLLYRSKHDPHHICAAIFDRPHCRFTVSTTQRLSEMPHQWAAILRTHGKGIA